MACETVLTTGLVLVAGEITTSAHLDIPEIVRSTIARDIGYTSECGFDGDACAVLVALDRQLARRTSPRASKWLHRGAPFVQREQANWIGWAQAIKGMMFGYATNETPGS